MSWPWYYQSLFWSSNYDAAILIKFLKSKKIYVICKLNRMFKFLFSIQVGGNKIYFTCWTKKKNHVILTSIEKVIRWMKTKPLKNWNCIFCVFFLHISCFIYSIFFYFANKFKHFIFSLNLLKKRNDKWIDGIKALNRTK